MSTAQQLGLIGNSIKVQSLPTASAETFGAGNRFYTLIGQQEGYITGHTYHTIVANDVYSWEDVAGGNYNMLDNIPVINQDLSASGFTPTANTYYRHTGATTGTFTQGVIYLYDTSYHKLGESGGGTTLNRYEYTVDLVSPTYAIRNRIMNIASNAKKYTMNASCRITLDNSIAMTLEGVLSFGDYYYTYSGVIGAQVKNTSGMVLLYNFGDKVQKSANIIYEGALHTVSNWSKITLIIVYYNDTEITA